MSSYKTRLNIFLAFMVVILSFIAYCYNTYSFIQERYKEKEIEYLEQLFELYKEQYLETNNFKSVYLKNRYYTANEQMIDEFSNSTPLFVHIDYKKRSSAKYIIKIQFFKAGEEHSSKVKKYIHNLEREEFKIYSDKNRQVLFARYLDKGFVYLEKNPYIYMDDNSKIVTFFLFFGLVGFLNLLLGYILLAKIKYNIEEEKFMQNKYETLESDTIKIALEDRLTGASTRLKFDQSIKDLVHTSSRFREQKFSLLLLDIDNFKSVNDTHGHDYGDIVLVEVAKVIKEHIRQSDIFARWGGEEFVVLLPLIELENAIVFSQKIRQLISEIKFEKLDQITCSFGLVEFQEGDDEKTILKRADEFLYKAKKTGKNKVVYE